MAPKGKRGPRSEMRVISESGVTVISEDFLPDQPKKKFGKRLADEAKKQGMATEGMSLAEQEEQLRQASLLPADGSAPLKPPTVLEGKMMENFVGPHYALIEGERYVDLEFSFPLTPEHKGMMPRSVEEAWNFLERNGSTKVLGIEIGDQTLDVFLAPDHEKELHLTAVPVTKASLAIVEQTGKGTATKEVRFIFRVRAEIGRNVCTFADWQFGNVVWIEMDDTQGTLTE
jgi:hypothetical protein